MTATAVVFQPSHRSRSRQDSGLVEDSKKSKEILGGAIWAKARVVRASRIACVVDFGRQGLPGVQ
jgi:hypothetical protein